jgi:hypothetical protein
MSSAAATDSCPRGMPQAPFHSIPIYIANNSPAEHEKSKPRKESQSTSGDLQPAATPPLSAKTSPNLPPMASQTLHISQPPKASHNLQDGHEPALFHHVSPLEELQMDSGLSHLSLRTRPPVRHHLRVHSSRRLPISVEMQSTRVPAMLHSYLDYELGRCHNAVNITVLHPHLACPCSLRIGLLDASEHLHLPASPARDQMDRAPLLNRPTLEMEPVTTR